MEGLAKKIEGIETRLNGLIQAIETNLYSGHGNSRSGNTTQLPNWAQRLFATLSDILEEVGTVKKTLGTDTPGGSGSGLPQEGASARPVNESDPSVTPTQIQCGVRPTAITESQWKVQLLTDVPERISTTVPLDNSAPCFNCKFNDIGPKLNEPRFEEFSSHHIVKDKGYFKISVQCLPPPIVAEGSIARPGKNHFTTFSCQRDTDGFVYLKKARNKEVQMPCFPLPATPKDHWSQCELKEFWESTLRNPPQVMGYIIGDPLFPDVKLGPGQVLEERNGLDLPGIGTTYMYLSSGVTCSIMHGEDVDLRSINLLRSGAHKSWLIVPPTYADKLRRKMREQFPTMADCSQAVRHLSCLITPSQLDNWAIPYSLDYCKPGEAIVTEPRAFHEVLNMGPNHAVAINIQYRSSPLIPKDYRFCRKDCDPHAITAAHFEIPSQVALRVANKATRPLPKRADPRTKVAQAKRRLVEPRPVAGRKRTASQAEPRPNTLMAASDINKLSEAVLGKGACRRLRTLVHAWRDRSNPFFELKNCKILAVRLVHIIEIGEERSILTEFVNRLAKTQLADIIDQGKSSGRVLADPNSLNELLDHLEWPRTKQTRQRLHDWLKEGRRWKRCCGTFEGLLCLLPPNREDAQRISGRNFYELKQDDIRRFHSHLGSNSSKPLIDIGNTIQKAISNIIQKEIGNTIQKAIDQSTEIPEFAWESEDPLVLDRLSVNELAPFMKEFHVIKENEFHPNKYEWPKPDFWLWEWPVCKFPSWIPPSEARRCDLCEHRNCQCIVSCLPQSKPRISNEPGKGQGVRAVGTYEKGQILAEYLGEFVPLDTFHDGWSVEFGRPDLGHEPIAQIYSKHMGNWSRKINHSCDPSAEFVVRKISDRWRQVIIAIKKISHDEEITAFCGTNFLRGQGKPCACSVCSR